jgi:hypothetical protein
VENRESCCRECFEQDVNYLVPSGLFIQKGERRNEMTFSNHNGPFYSTGTTTLVTTGGFIEFKGTVAVYIGPPPLPDALDEDLLIDDVLDADEISG